jgi:hypothetical protein
MSDRPFRAAAVSIACFLRSVPLLFYASPRTPLRILAIVAIDTLHVLRDSKPLPRKQIYELAMLLDFQAGTNAAWDDKHWCEAEHHSLRQKLDQAGLGPCVSEYLRRLGSLESRRPATGGDLLHFDEVRAYREAVVRLSLATAIARDTDRLDDVMRAMHDDGNVAALFRIVMQCQIMDDVVDYAEDRSAGLPSFLTACASLPQAIELTTRAAEDYGSCARSSTASLSPVRTVLPLRLALRFCTAVTTFVVHVAHPRPRHVRPALAGGPASSR